MIFNIHAGHNPAGKIACGAAGIINESTENRKVKDLVIAKLKALGHTVYDCTVDDGTSQSNVLSKIVSKCNSHNVDYDISIHFNAGGGVGTECWIYPSGTSKELASNICNSISELGFRNRGVKTTGNLYFLNKTKAKAILIECCFVDSDDAYKYHVEDMANAIVKGLVGESTSAVIEPVASTPKITNAQPVYRVKTLKRGWLPEVVGTSDYAGVENDPIVGIMIKNGDDSPVTYQSYCGGRWLGNVSGYDVNDYYHGWSGDGENPITAIYVNGKHYKVSTIKSTGYYPAVYDREDYAGDKKNSIDKIMIWN